jgi:hypothetical protein
MQELKDIIDQLKPGDIILQETDRTLSDFVQDLHEYLGNNEFLQIASNTTTYRDMGGFKWKYPVWCTIDSKIVPKKDLVLYTHWIYKGKRFFDLLKEI